MNSNTSGSVSAAHVIRLAAGFALLVALTLPAASQTQSSDTPKERQESVEVIPLTHATSTSATDLITALRNVSGSNVRAYLDTRQNSVVVRGTTEEIAMAHKVIAALDKPIAHYKLTYFITETEDGKPADTQHYTLLVSSGEKVAFREGRRVPIITGKFDADSSGPETQFQYVDVGLSIDATLEGSTLHSKVDESALADEKSSVGIQDPVIIQSLLQSVTTITPGKPAALGLLVTPKANRRREVGVLVERVE